jgi:hypothetical protein
LVASYPKKLAGQNKLKLRRKKKTEASQMAPCYAVLRRATPCRAPQLCFASLKKENGTAALCSKHRGVYWSKKVRCAQPKICF